MPVRFPKKNWELRMPEFKELECLDQDTSFLSGHVDLECLTKSSKKMITHDKTVNNIKEYVEHTVNMQEMFPYFPLFFGSFSILPL